MLGSGEIGKWQLCSWKHWNKILTALGKSPLPCCVASARHTHLPVISHSLVISFCGGDYNQLRRYGNVRDQAAVLNRCIVPLSLLCPPSKPMAVQAIQWRAGIRAFLRVGGADSLDFCKSSCPTLELCYSLWNKQGLSIVMVQCWFQRIYKLQWIYGEQRLRPGGLHHVAAFCSLWINQASGGSAGAGGFEGAQLQLLNLKIHIS